VKSLPRLKQESDASKLISKLVFTIMISLLLVICGVQRFSPAQGLTGFGSPRQSKEAAPPLMKGASRTDDDKNWRLLGQLVARHKLIGMTRRDVIRRLGPAPGGWCIVYSLIDSSTSPRMREFQEATLLLLVDGNQKVTSFGIASTRREKCR
jgi:hypothetical protein